MAISAATATMIAGLAAAGATGTAAGVNAIAAGKLNRRSVRYNKWALQQQNKFNAEQAQISRDWQREYYEQYQSPEAQVRQYQQAGLNPALMYEGAPTLGTPPSGATASSGAALPLDQQNPAESLMNLGDMILDMQRMRNEAKNLEYDNLVKDKQAAALVQEALLTGETINITKKQGKRLEAEIGEILSRVEINKKTKERIEQEIISIGLKNKLDGYQVSINNMYQSLTEKLGLSIPITNEIISSFVSATGNVVSGGLQALGNGLGSLFGLFKLFKGNKGKNIPFDASGNISGGSYSGNISF